MHSLTSALDGGEWSASRLGRFTSRDRVPGTHSTGGWVGPRASLDAVAKRKISSRCRESNPDPYVIKIRCGMRLQISMNYFSSDESFSVMEL
jgi:hypothetical protein